MSTWLSDVAQLHFLRPWWLLALLLVPALWWWQRKRVRQSSAWRDVVDAHLLPHLLEPTGATSRRAWAGMLGLCGLVFSVLALAGPSLRKDIRPLWQARAPLVLALDLSSATRARDLPPDRLVQARVKLARLLRARAGGQVALVAFAEDAYTVAPLTTDAANVALFLDALSPEVMPMDGHRPDRAIAWSQRLLRQAGFEHGAIVLLTDHADAQDMAAAQQARAAGYRISVIGLGSEHGGVFDTGNGLQQARLDATSLRKLASSGGGRYATMTTDDADVRALGVLDPATEDTAAAPGETLSSWRDDGVWLLPLVLLFCLPLFRRSGALVVVLLCGLWLPLLPLSVQAQTQTRGQPSGQPPEPAAAAPIGTWWQRADQAAYARMQAGIAAYRQQHYAGAIAQLSALHDADGQYNLGNALARAGRYDEAIAAYDRALQQQPKMADAQFNRRVVEQARRKQQQPPQQSQS
ncbi:VWA domain-containing protein, partial [uncultured Thermomonas sp.]